VYRSVTLLRGSVVVVVVVGTVVVICVSDDWCMAHDEFPKGLIKKERTNKYNNLS